MITPSAQLLSRRLPLILAIGILASGATAAAWLVGRRLNRQAYLLGKVPDRIGLNAPFITSPNAVVDKMVEMADLKEGDMAYDLGCGDGRIIITAALKTGCHGVGYDIDPQQDIFTADLSGADAVLMYVLPWMTRKLIPQLRQMQPGARVISHQFNLGDEPELSPEKTEQIRVPKASVNHYVHRWTAPLKPVPNVR